MAEPGYAGNILKVDLSSGSVTRAPTMDYAASFVGGRGIAARVYWDEVPPEVGAFDPENRLIFMTGPVCGVPGFGGRFQICGKSALNSHFSYCNVGGSWGAQLKAAGYDGLVVSGKADRPVYIWIDGGVEIRPAGNLRGTTAFDCERMLKEELGESVRVLTTGPAGENMVSFATFLASDNSVGAGGLAGVMGSKNLKAIAVRGRGKVVVADREKLSKIRSRIRKLSSGFLEPMLGMGLLTPAEKLRKSLCDGCAIGCVRATYDRPDGVRRKFMCQAAMFYETRADRHYGKWTEVPFKATELCDDYGLDTRAVETMIMWLSRCHKAGIVSDEQTGIPFSQIGSHEFIEALVRKISRREGFGDVLAEGTHKAAARLGSEAQKLIKDYMTRTGDNELYGARLYITTGIFWAMEPRLPIQQLHEVSVPVMLWAARAQGVNEIPVTSDVMRAMAKRFYGSELAVDFSTYDGKALAAARIQDREYAKECLIMCDLAWPIYFTNANADHVGDPSLDSQICSAVTGREVDEADLCRIGERVFNLQRAILSREGRRGREHDTIDEYNFTTPAKGDFGNQECLVPGKNGEVFSRKGMVVDRALFEKVKDEFYGIRGWDVATGLQTRAKLAGLGLEDISGELERRGLLAAQGGR